MEINDLIFKELLKRGYSLEGNTRIWNIADSKLWYLTPEQAQAYLDLEQSEEYREYMFQTEINMLNKNMPEIIEKIAHGSAINIIDIGCGDGKKAVPVLDKLYGKMQLRYCPIDISSHMVREAIKKIKKLGKGEVVEFSWNISDFDNLENISSLLREKEFRQNFFLFLGSTIGNFEPHEVMYEIAEAMESDEDYLLMGLALSNKMPKDILASYKNDMNDKFLSLILLELGFERDEIEFGARYKNSRVELLYTIKKDKRLTLGEKSIDFVVGDQILVAVSYRHSEESLKTLLNAYFEDYKIFVNDDKSWALALCKK